MRRAPLGSSILGLSLIAACASSEEKHEPATEQVLAVKQTPQTRGGDEDFRVVYPETRRGEVVDDYHGTKVADPYRWLEDPDSDETVAWVKAQNKVTFGFLKKSKERKALKQRITKLWNYERYTPPFREGKRWYFFKNDGLQNQSVMYRLDSLEAEPKVLLDPNQWSEEGTTALGGYSFSEDGELLAYSKSEGGSDWRTWHVIKIATGEQLSDEIKWSKFSGASWTHDGKGFFYSRYPEPEKGDELDGANYYHKVYYHRLGEPQSKDTLVFEDKDNKTRGFSAWVTEDGHYLMIHVWEGTDRRNRLYYKRLKKNGAYDASSSVVKLLDDFDAGYHFVGNSDAVFYIRTDLDAPRGRLIAIDTKHHARKNWKTLIPQGDDKLESVSMIGGGLLANWLHDAHDKVTFHGLDGKQQREIELPVIGTVYGFAGKPDDTETFYALTSFTYPSVIFHLDLKTGKSREYRRPDVDFDTDAYETKQVFYESKDGTRIPMFLVHKKGLAYSGDNPTELYGYGGFNVNLTPAFNPALVAWLERGGVYAQPTLRGGGEYGEEWHEAGMLDNKQNVFDDFAWAAKWLYANKVTQKDKLFVRGGSNGGLLVGASITQRPELFGAGVAQVGVLDMLRYHKFTIGHAWVNEYGSSDDAEQFAWLMQYSPLHNLKEGTRYPPVLITTADHDDRVVPAHSFKFAAEIQRTQAKDGPPVLIRIDTKAGHGAGKSTTKLIEEIADRYAFVLEVFGE
jgi:prolyl oligopeptidase